MKDFFDILIQILTVDIFIGYGLFSLIFILITIFKSDIRLLDRLDISANRLIIFSGIVYFLSVVIATIISASINESQTDRGQYWWAPWLQPLIWVLTTQLLWIERIRTKKIIRLLIAVLLIVSFEMYVIIVTSFHRDYLTGSGSLFNGISTFDLIIGLTSKVVIFCILATIFSLTIDQIKKFKSGVSGTAGNTVFK